MPNKTHLAWHFVRESRRLGYADSDMEVVPGYIYSIDRDRRPVLCEYGMHASERAIDALKYAPGPIVCRVRVWGDVLDGGDKIVGRHREVMWMADATRTLHEFAVWCVREMPIGNGRTVWDLLTDERSRNAVIAKERWLRGEITDAELDAARDAARDAAVAAARAAALAAARDAARDAAVAAARAAALAAARDAARDAAVAAGCGGGCGAGCGGGCGAGCGGGCGAGCGGGCGGGCGAGCGVGCGGGRGEHEARGNDGGQCISQTS
jgi:hypothetical protein